VQASTGWQEAAGVPVEVSVAASSAQRARLADTDTMTRPRARSSSHRRREPESAAGPAAATSAPRARERGGRPPAALQVDVARAHGLVLAKGYVPFSSCVEQCLDQSRTAPDPPARCRHEAERARTSRPPFATVDRQAHPPHRPRTSARSSPAYSTFLPPDSPASRAVPASRQLAADGSLITSAMPSSPARIPRSRPTPGH